MFGATIFSSNFVCPDNNSFTCIVLQDFWLAEKGWDGRWGTEE